MVPLADIMVRTLACVTCRTQVERLPWLGFISPGGNLRNPFAGYP